MISRGGDTPTPPLSLGGSELFTCTLESSDRMIRYRPTRYYYEASAVFGMPQKFSREVVIFSVSDASLCVGQSTRARPFGKKLCATRISKGARAQTDSVLRDATQHVKGPPPSWRT